MKKKIKDLKPTEMYDLCKKAPCSKCPLHTSGAGSVVYALISQTKMK